jgi:Protein of unknown function (DUF3551)
MNVALFMLSIFVVTAGVSTRAEAQNYPWCAVLNMGDVAYNCGFSTHDQCLADVSGIGGFCMQNNTYQPPVAHTRAKSQTN